ncbi:hypothetical protein DdX_09533 [Ditylenchus destructor]|uniref:Uncharacterized protein n=1 Tax=Ditylenchus destructor TaxID=166010 RepID=A0AAD4R2Z5_9BILA|nr:hypothetical protein DdX_09533 [Ditylenchus destructor]
MPSRSSPNFQNFFCSNDPQPAAACVSGVGVPAVFPFFAMAIEVQIKPYSLPMLRLVYICPTLSIVASVFTVVAYCKRISPGYIIALTLNGISLLGWIVALGWLIISWASSGYFGKLDMSDFIYTFIEFFAYMGLISVVEGMLYCAYLDSKQETHSSIIVNRP